ncbi:uncharacterized protein [Blastocystis hominis]|uniref:Uncharacterized protein n=1 Tax=Blastocystis hominis TaxID=12968 RepID=D8M4R9_BLAHO|nr:uncharacterized protein [Blastocystis hominis]CBK23058.2 unnamed protein product [Blastocystis hominis]|eukprot:XP_012897106.1 uncharacterized protein [Blastocystis hominis]
MINIYTSELFQPQKCEQNDAKHK